jgi:hypothetical protein
MSHTVEPNFSISEQAVLDEIDKGLRSQGWATHATVAWLLQEWQALSVSVDQYALTIDDYTNDLTARDGLKIAVATCPEPLRSKLMLSIELADGEFIARTHEDAGRTLGRYFRIDEASGWWWRRTPTAGQLAEFLISPAPA